MAEVKAIIKHGWVWVFSILIFFCDSLSVLPEGLTLVLLLTPLWLYFLYTENKLQMAAVLLVPLLLYIPIHLLNGVNLSQYFISETMLVALILFVAALYFLIHKYEINFDLIFRDIVILNFFLVLVSLVLLFVPALKEAVWYSVPISSNLKPIPRLKLFASEASHYSFLMAPIAIYFYSRAIFFKASNTWLMLFMVSLPLILSFSLGVLAGLFISGFLVSCFYFRRVFYSKKRWLMLFSVIILLSAAYIILYYWFPGNLLFARIQNIFTGRDTSFRGRTYEAFILANKIAEVKSSWWGVGPGQVKLIGRDIIVQYYYYSRIPSTIRIPNACAETIAYFGYIGFALRMLVEWWLFFKTKVFANPFRLWLFLFVFIYQFSGSYISNPIEYILWILAFSNIFPEFLEIKTSDLTDSD